MRAYLKSAGCCPIYGHVRAVVYREDAVTSLYGPWLCCYDCGSVYRPAMFKRLAKGAGSWEAAEIEAANRAARCVAEAVTK